MGVCLVQKSCSATLSRVGGYSIIPFRSGLVCLLRLFNVLYKHVIQETVNKGSLYSLSLPILLRLLNFSYLCFFPGFPTFSQLPNIRLQLQPCTVAHVTTPIVQQTTSQLTLLAAGCSMNALSKVLDRVSRELVLGLD